ncbi:MAG TPA: hypothetical protein VFQ47_02595, partial [Nitrososphaera sp.]|nr:hypothetical protein [Nitrososphaera sp.]
MSENQLFDQNREETQLTDYLIEQVCGRAAGRIQDVPGECWYNPPRDVYFIGNLRPRPDDPTEILTEPNFLRELRNKLAPIAFGGDFRALLNEVTASITVTVSWDCYYRIFPTRAQQIDHQRRQLDVEGNTVSNSPAAGSSDSPAESAATPSGIIADNDQVDPDTDEESVLLEEQEKEELRTEEESPEAIETSQDRRRTRQVRDSLFVRFRKIHCRATGQITLQSNNGEWTADWNNLQTALDDETTRAQQIAMADDELIRCDDDPMGQITIPESALDSDQAFEAFLQSLKTPIVPEWKWQVGVELRPSETNDPSERIIQFALINVSPSQSPAPAAGSSRRRDNPNIEPFLFDTKATFEFNEVTVLPFELELAPRGFRYNRELWGRGFNCAIERNITEDNIFSTTHTPISRQRRYTTRNSPPARFADLARDPLSTLEAIAGAMDEYLSEWDRWRATYAASKPNWGTQFSGSFEEDRQQFENEIVAFRRGCQLIRDNADVRLAFELTNETFRRVGEHP